MKLESPATIIDFDPFSVRTNTDLTPTHSLGESILLSDHRRFRYGKAGGSNISPGKLQTAPAQKTNHHNCVAIASVAGTTQPTFTLGNTAAVANEYAEGYVSINVTPDVGRVYKIASLGAVAALGTANPVLFEPIQTAWTTATKVNLVHNAYSGLIEGTVQTRRLAGVPLVAMATTNFGWVQTRGIASVLADGTIAIGSYLAPSGSVAGAVIAVTGTYATDLVTTPVGFANIMAGVTAEYRPMFLTID